MKSYHFVSLCVIAILMADHFADAVPYKEAKLTITPTNDQPITQVHLKQVKSFLANEHVPMWIVKNGETLQLNSQTVMRDLGSFTTYQDATTSSAAVYFHKHQEFEGTIDIRYVIKELSIPDNVGENPSTGQQNINDGKVNKVVFERLDWGHSAKKCVVEKEFRFPRVFSEWSGEKLSDENVLIDPSFGNNVDEFYIETLVIINYDMARQFVDMLFSKISSLKIRINIAGIIIGNERGSFCHLDRCYRKVSKFHRTVEAMDVTCVNECIEAYLSDQKRKIPLDSYDITIFLTRHSIYEYENNGNMNEPEVVHLSGLAKYAAEGIYDSKKNGGQSHPRIYVEDIAHFESFAVIAHEMIHAFGIGEHDPEVDMEDGMCCEKLMKPYNAFCQYCLDWSMSTALRLNALLRLHDGCIFKNKPRSLYPPGPRPMLTADEQCQCYRYESAKTTRKSYLNTILTWFADYCDVPLQCQDGNGNIYGTLVPMDGTPCDDNTGGNKVCWNRSCTEVVH